MNELPLRERKYASMKAVLLQAVLTRLKDQTLDSISVKEVCREAEVSETTFFNYFASKHAVILYFVQIWSITVAWEMQQTLSQGGSHLDAIRALFELTAKQVAQTPGVMGEIVVWQSRNRDEQVYSPLTRAEYARHFPGKTGIDQIEAQGIDKLLGAQLEAAHRAGELKADFDTLALLLTLMSIFFMTPILLQEKPAVEIGDAFRRQLRLAGIPAAQT